MNIKIEYEGFPAEAREIREKASEVNDKICGIYKMFEEMNRSWRGKRYNDLAKQCNGVIGYFDKLLQLVVTQLPFELETVANNYSLADSGSKIVGMPEQRAVKKITQVPTPDPIDVYISIKDVEDYRTNIGMAFDNVNAMINQIDTRVKHLKWEGQAAGNYKAEINNLKDQIQKSVTEIRKAFSTKMNEAMEDMKLAETSSDKGPQV